MRHFVAYHNEAKMGYPYDVANGEYAFMSRKPLAYLEQTVGQTVWAFNGAPSRTRNRIYTLRSCYSPDQIIDTSHPDFNYVVSGFAGFDFNPPIELNSRPWFPPFLKSQTNFSLGINEIREQRTIDHLVALGERAGAFGDDLSISLPKSRKVDSWQQDIEGRPELRVHLRRERSSSLVRAKKEQVLNATRRLACEACGFDFARAYGELGEGFCEVHHKTPLAALEGERITRMNDLAIVCANCHRVLHRNDPMPSVEQVRARMERD